MATQTAKKYKFKIVRGTHSEDGKVYSHNKNSVIETDNDLTKHNRPGAIKFLQLSEEEVKAIEKEEEVEEITIAGSIYSLQDFETMTVADLTEFATEEEIDLKGVTRKQDIIKAIVQASE